MTNWRHRDPNEATMRHPAESRGAFLYVSRDARLVLMYQIEAAWHATSANLENVGSSNEVLSHAAMGEEGDHLLVVTYDLAKRFCLYKIVINWNATQHTRQNGMVYVVVAPIMDVARLTALENITPQQADTARLSGLHVMPAVHQVAEQGALRFPMVLAIFTRAFLPADPTQPQEAFSVIARWHVESEVHTLHESFSKLKKSGTAPTQSSITLLRRQEDIITNKMILSIDSLSYNTLLACSASDGTVEFLHRSTMTNVEPYGDTTMVSSLPQNGFEHVMGEHSLHTAISADGSAMATVKIDGHVISKLMSLRYGWDPLDDGISDTQDLIEAAVVCIARQYAILLCASAANDEILALIPHHLSRSLRRFFVKEIVRITNRTLDIALQEAAKQQMMMLKEPLLSRAMSAQLVIGTTFTGSASERTAEGNFAFATLQMRLICQAFAPLVSKPEFFIRPDYIHGMRGIAKWGCDLLIYIVDSVVSMKRNGATVSDASAKQALEESIAETANPSIHLILNAFSRAYLRFMASNIPKYLTAVQKVIPTARSALERQQLRDIWEFGTYLPFKFIDFDAFMTDVDAAIRSAYTSSEPASERRGEIELITMTENSIPNELTPVVRTLLDSALPKLLERVDRSRLHFWNTDWLGFSSSGKGTEYDAIRKIPLTKGMKLRVCRRCGAKMEDLVPERVRELPPWIGHAQRHCVCGNYWINE